MTQDQENARHAMIKLSDLWVRGITGVAEMSKEDKLKAERDELASKIKRLKRFMKSDTFKNMDSDDQIVLKIQKNSMQAYKQSLDWRLYWEIY